MVPCSVVELRQYTLHPGQRDTLVSLFERELIETQEAAGIRVLGQFEDLDRPDRFVWFRGFAGMAARHAALTAFYGGAVWAEHRDAANATMADSDDVLLLHPLRPAGGFPGRDRAATGTRETRRVLVRVFHRAPGVTDLDDFCLEHVEPALAGTGAPIVAWLETHHERNDFPRLPVREDADVVLCLSVLPDEGALRRHLALLAADLAWAEEVVPALRRRISRDPEHLVLRATPRSALF
ncbi:MAG TPA: NIPSNAP family protein [Myxococcaceae bacterium]|nr:NIPSNAP family protein [Myxococcaceae bacterium]